MTIRIYQPIELNVGLTIKLDEQATHHLLHVLRATINTPLTLFNGQGGEYFGEIIHIEKKQIFVGILSFQNPTTSSPLKIVLGQAIPRSDKMDYIVQKTTELGVAEITPIITTRCQIRRNQAQASKHVKHLEQVMISACEQCGRNELANISEITTLADWIQQTNTNMRFYLSPTAKERVHDLIIPAASSISLLIGPEGGLTKEETGLAEANQFIPLRLGPRILRTETAAIASVAIFQTLFGDLS